MLQTCYEIGSVQKMAPASNLGTAENRAKKAAMICDFEENYPYCCKDMTFEAPKKA